MRRIEISSEMIPAERDQASRELERGNILYLPSLPFEMSDADRQFLLGQQQSEAGYHKNVAYRFLDDRVTGLKRKAREDEARMRQVLRRYSDGVIGWMQDTFPWYAQGWRLDYASFRPLEEQDRVLSPRSRNDLLHVDAFPSRPTRGDRILRFFTNLHPTRPRIWLTGQPMDWLVPRYGAASGLLAPGRLRQRIGEHVSWAMKRLAGHPIPRRSAYDVFMLRFHDYLKAHTDYQANGEKFRWEFPPGSCWIVLTDMVPHAVLSGQFALEMTFIVPVDTMLLPDMAPIRLLELEAGFPLR